MVLKAPLGPVLLALEQHVPDLVVVEAREARDGGVVPSEREVACGAALDLAERQAVSVEKACALVGRELDFGELDQHEPREVPDGHLHLRLHLVLVRVDIDVDIRGRLLVVTGRLRNDPEPIAIVS